MFTLYDEIPEIEASNYSRFGKSQPLYKSQNIEDPVKCCLPGAFLNCHELAQLDRCPNFMSSKCAINWDQSCELYQASLDGIDLIRDFQQQTAAKKFFQLDKNSNCSIYCQPFNPMEQESPTMCTYFGNETLVDTNDNIDIGYTTPVNISPDFFGKCKLIADPTMLQGMEKNDKVIDNCLASGLCDKQMVNICQVAIDKNVTINDPNLVSYCKNAGYEVNKAPIAPLKSFKSDIAKLDNKSSVPNYMLIGGGLLVVGLLIYFMMMYNKHKGRRLKIINI